MSRHDSMPPTWRALTPQPKVQMEAVGSSLGVHTYHAGARAPASAAGEDKPEIALILADDFMPSSLAAYPEDDPQSPNLQMVRTKLAQLTPHLNGLAARRGAVAVKKAYSASALCTPSRISLLTGRYPSRLYRRKDGMGEAVSQIQFAHGPDPVDFKWMTTLPRMFAKVGYATGFLGKWHVNLPADTELYAAKVCGASWKVKEQGCLSKIVMAQGGFDFAEEIYIDNDCAKAGGHHPESMTVSALQFVRSARTAKVPFFLWMAPTLTHPPDNFREALGQEPSDLDPNGDAWTEDRQCRALYCSEVEWKQKRQSVLERLDAAGVPSWSPHAGAAWLDATLGPLLDELDKGKNVLTIFSGDHGNGKSGKGSVYEGGVQVPLLLHWSAHPACEAWAATAPVVHLDLMPTLAALVGGEAAQHADGRDVAKSLWPSRFGSECEEGTLKRELFFEVGYGRAIVSDHEQWKLIRVPRPRGPQSVGSCISWYGDPIPWQPGAPGTPDPRLVYKSFALHQGSYCNETQLFNLKSDPKELINRARRPEHQELVHKLAQRLQEHVAAGGTHKDGAEDALVGFGVIANVQ